MRPMLAEQDVRLRPDLSRPNFSRQRTCRNRCTAVHAAAEWPGDHRKPLRIEALLSHLPAILPFGRCG